MAFGRRRFRVTVHGSDILIHSEDADEPIIGFRAVRFVRAKDPDEARSIAVARVRSEWFSSPFCSVNRSQAPVITVDEIERIKNPLRRSRPNRGYDFYRDGEGRA